MVANKGEEIFLVTTVISYISILCYDVFFQKKPIALPYFFWQLASYEKMEYGTFSEITIFHGVPEIQIAYILETGWSG